MGVEVGVLAGTGVDVGVEVGVSVGTGIGVIVGTGVAVAIGAGRACPESIEGVKVGTTVDVGGGVTVGVDVRVGLTVSVGGSKVGDAHPATSRLTNPTSTHLVAFIVLPLHTQYFLLGFLRLLLFNRIPFLF